MNKKILALLFLLWQLPLSAQERIGYSYDANGNRIRQGVIILAAKSMPRRVDAQESTFYSDSLSLHSVKIYPNLTKGMLKVSISGLKDSDTYNMSVYTTAGAQVFINHVKTEETDIDISNLPSGIYILRITINNKSTTWKIIKE